MKSSRHLHRNLIWYRWGRIGRTSFSADPRLFRKPNMSNVTDVNKPLCRHMSAITNNYLVETSCQDSQNDAKSHLMVVNDFLSAEEEKSLFSEVERYLKKLRYEYDHWDNAIHGFRETEKASWLPENQLVIDRVRSFAFPSCSSHLAHVHVLDLSAKGYIKPHIDSVRFCGSTIAGLSLLSPSIMKFVHDKDKSKTISCLLPPRSLYIMRDKVRYEYTHEILKDEESYIGGEHVPKDRRISVICRSEPERQSSGEQ